MKIDFEDAVLKFFGFWIVLFFALLFIGIGLYSEAIITIAAFVGIVYPIPILFGFLMTNHVEVTP